MNTHMFDLMQNDLYCDPNDGNDDDDAQSDDNEVYSDVCEQTEDGSFDYGDD
jgi:hypothetical protein